MEVDFLQPFLDIEAKTALVNPGEVTMAQNLDIGIVEGETVEEVFRDSFWAGVRVSAGMTRKWPLNRLIRSIRVIRVQTLSLAALHTEGAEDGSEDGDDEIDYFLNCFLFHFY